MLVWLRFDVFLFHPSPLPVKSIHAMLGELRSLPHQHPQAQMSSECSSGFVSMSFSSTTLLPAKSIPATLGELPVLPCQHPQAQTSSERSADAACAPSILIYARQTPCTAMSTSPGPDER